MILAKVIVFAVLVWMLDSLAETDELMKKYPVAMSALILLISVGFADLIINWLAR